jgi:hypothetical protein
MARSSLSVLHPAPLPPSVARPLFLAKTAAAADKAPPLNYRAMDVTPLWQPSFSGETTPVLCVQSSRASLRAGGGDLTETRPTGERPWHIALGGSCPSPLLWRLPPAGSVLWGDQTGCLTLLYLLSCSLTASLLLALPRVFSS